jgi:5-formyltetrahydrofolate cyclo-ligase
MENDKELLRIWLKKKRLAMDLQQVESLTAQICQSLIESVNWHNIKSVHSYTAIRTLNEVDTSPIIEFISKEYPEIIIFKQGQNSISPQASQRFDLIIVPTLGFDGRLHRIGWGGGFYDRFLSSQSQALKAGLGYESGFVKRGLPTKSHNIALNLIVTEKRVLKYQP